MFKKIFKRPDPMPITVSRFMAGGSMFGMAMGLCGGLIVMGLLEGMSATGHLEGSPSLSFGVFLVVLGCVGAAGLMWAFNRITQKVEARYALVDTKADPTAAERLS